MVESSIGVSFISKSVIPCPFELIFDFTRFKGSSKKNSNRSIKCVKTFKNQRKEHDTQHFHIDENSVKLLKVFIYLNDVNSKKDGPFYYVQDSFKNIKEKWGKNARWDENYLKKEYGVKKFKPILAKRGDIIFANTVAFHRGIKPIAKDRNIIILNYGMHVDFTFNNKLDITSKILKRDLLKLTKKHKSILSLLSTVN